MMSLCAIYLWLLLTFLLFWVKNELSYSNLIFISQEVYYIYSTKMIAYLLADENRTTKSGLERLQQISNCQICEDT